MSSLNQFYAKSFANGFNSFSSQFFNLPGVRTFSDGSKWASSSNQYAIPYDSSYGTLAPWIEWPYELISGPSNGLFDIVGGYSRLAHDTNSGIYCTSAVDYNTANGADCKYYTSTDGINWTARYFPYSNIYRIVVFINGYFYAIGSAYSANAILRSSDGVTWSSSTGIAFSASSTFIVFDGSNTILICSGTSVVRSADNGVTWSTSTPTNFNIGSSSTAMPYRGGAVIYHSNSGLFISIHSSNSYSTSPDGITWTLRNPSNFKEYKQFSYPAPVFATNGTKLIAFGYAGRITSSTDGVNWVTPTFITSEMGLGTPNIAWHDGTYFVVRYGNIRTFYSTDGISWNEGKPAVWLSQTANINTNNTVYFLSGVIGNAGFGYYSKMTNPSDKTTKYLLSQLIQTTNGSSVMTRIK